MIENQIIEKAELIENFPLIDIFSSKKINKIYKFFYIILRHKTHNPLLLLFIRILFFIQLMQHSMIGAPREKIKADFLMNILYSFRYFVFPHLLINSDKKFIFLLSCSFFYSFLLIILLLYLTLNYKKNFNIYLIRFLGLLNCIHVNYMICPLININGLILKCENGNHIYLKVECYSNQIHIFLLVVSLINLIFLFFYSIIVTIHFNEIGGIKISGTLKRTNTYFELNCYCFSFIIYIIGFIHKNFFEKNTFLRIYTKLFYVIYGFILFFYLNFYVYFYKFYMNYFMLTGFCSFTWYTLILLITFIFKINTVVLLISIGWFFIFILIYFLLIYKNDCYLFQSNIFENENLEKIEIFINNFNSLAQKNDNSTKVYIHGIINTFEEYIMNYQEEEELYQSLINNNHMKKTFGNNNILLKMNSIIYCIYHYFMEKSVYLKDDMLLLFCYFLVNNLKNSTYTIYLCSRKKIIGYKNNFLKFTLMEDIKEYMTERLLQNNIKNKDSIKHIEITKVILYNKYSEKLRLKIFEATQLQADYFNFLKSSSDNSTENFLSLGNKIIDLRKQILNLWNEIINLNPFCDEIELDLIMYLDNIIQDDDLLIRLNKNFYNIKERKILEKNNKYHKLFNFENSSILLFDGFNDKGKLLYYTINFPKIYKVNNEKELLNLYLEDLVPKCISNFHNKLIEDALEYSNLKNVFGEEKNLPLQLKDTLFNVNGFVKSLPSFSNGLIFIVSLQKQNSNQFLIFLSDGLQIDSMTNISSISENEIDFFYQKNYWIYPYNLKPSIFGNHIATLIPEILLLIEYKNDKFFIQSNVTEYKGNIFSNVINSVSIRNKLDKIYQQIKLNGKLNFFSHNKNNQVNSNKNETFIKHSSTFKFLENNNYDFKLYNDFLNEVKNSCTEKNNSIFFRIFHNSYFNDQFSFYKIFIQKDISVDIKINVLNYQKKKKVSETQFTQKVPKIKKKKFQKQITIFGTKMNLESSKKKKRDKIKKYFSNFSYDSSNLFQNQIIFNILKQNVINKKTPQNVIYLRISAFIFSILSLIIIIYNTNVLKNNFINMENFLIQNYFFNHTKQYTSFLYISFNNFQLVKKEFIQYEIFGKQYFNEMLIILKSVINDLIFEIESIYFIKEEYKNIIFDLKLIQFYVDNSKNKFSYNIDLINILYLLITNSLYFINNSNIYFNETNENLDFVLENIIDSSFDYSFSQVYGLNYEKRKKIIYSEKSYSINFIYIIIHLALFLIFFFFFICIVLKRFKSKKRLIEKMLNFQSKEFDDYIKYLEEIRKKLNNENEEEIDSENNNNEGLYIEEKNILKNFNYTINDMKKKKEKKEHEKEKRKKYHLQQLQKKEKKQIMIHFYILLEFFSSLKYCVILILFMSFYIIIYPIYITKRNNYLSYDNITSQIENISIETILNYIKMKKNIINYINFVKDKENCNNKLISGEKQCIINNISLTLSNISKHKFNFSIFNENIPVEDNIKFLKFIKNMDSEDLQNPEGELSILYYGNMCKILIKKNDNINLNQCTFFWNSILIQGLQQSIVYYNNLIKIILNQFIRTQFDSNLNLFNSVTLNLIEIEEYLLKYFYLTKSYSNSLFLKIKKHKSKKIINDLSIILLCFIVIYILLYLFIVLFIEQTKKNFCSFANFLVIFPHKYIIKDDEFYTALLGMKDFY